MRKVSHFPPPLPYTIYKNRCTYIQELKAAGNNHQLIIILRKIFIKLLFTQHITFFLFFIYSEAKQQYTAQKTSILQLLFKLQNIYICFLYRFLSFCFVLYLQIKHIWDFAWVAGGGRTTQQYVYIRPILIPTPVLLSSIWLR